MMKLLIKTFCLIFSIIIISYFFVGLLNYKDKIISLQRYQSKISANIVILTGGSNRIIEGFKILNNYSKSERQNLKILISGTGKGFTKNSLKRMLQSNLILKLVECCITLENISKDTYSNAIETSKWIKKNNIKEFLLITSNYHMPRAHLEFKNIMPKKSILNYSITPKRHKIKNWLKSPQTFSLIFVEYVKFILTDLRIKLLKI